MVKTYGTDQDSVVSMIRKLLDIDVHPPLYHSVLFYWMKMFGHSELVTRLLSSIYIILSIIMLYIITRIYFGQWVALASSFVYSLSFGVVNHALEARPYAQTLFLCTLASYFLCKWLDTMGKDFSWRGIFGLFPLFLAICNILLLLTHYYNVFLIMAQAGYVFLFFALRNYQAGIITNVIKPASFYLGQVVIVAILVGHSLLAVREEYGEKLATAAPTNPLSMLMSLSVEHNFWFLSTGFATILGVALVVYAVRMVSRSFRRPYSGVTSRVDFFMYLIFWLIGPFVLAYLVFWATDFESLAGRYFIFTLPPLSVLIVIAVREIIDISYRAARSIGLAFNHSHLVNARFYALVGLVILTVPSAYAAATQKKGEFREVAQSIANIVERDPGSKYLIYEGAFRGEAMLNYYFERFSPRVRAAGTFTHTAERRGRPSLKLEANEVGQYDYLVLAFPHQGKSKFPQTIKHLSRSHDVYLSQIGKNGRGYIILKIRPS